MAAGWADRVLICFPESAKYYRNPEKVETVGMPVRKEFIFTKREDARKKLGVDERPLIVSAFGSQGAKAMNEVMAQLFALEKEAGYPFRHIHAKTAAVTPVSKASPCIVNKRRCYELLIILRFHISNPSFIY